MSKFELDEPMIKVISSEFGLPPAEVKLIYDEYNAQINGLMEKQYLGHSIRAIEQFVYSNRGKFSFHVRCIELSGCPRTMCFDFGSYFLIWYPPTLVEKFFMHRKSIQKTLFKKPDCVKIMWNQRFPKCSALFTDS